MPRTVEKPSILMRVIYALPIIGLIARDIAKDPDAPVIFILLILISVG